jgi:probable metal-binding protein
MQATVHGHVILEHIIEVGGKIPLAELKAFAASHGSDATYYTCSASSMSFEGLMQFLESRGKVRLEGDTVTVFPEKMCQHGDDHAH